MSTSAEMEAAYLAMSNEELCDEYLEMMHRLSMILDRLKHQVRAKPVLGGCFGHGGFVLMSHWNVRSGLDVVTYYVAEASTRFVIAYGDSKDGVLDCARHLLSKWIDLPRLHAACSAYKSAVEAAEVERRLQHEQRQQERSALSTASEASKVRSIPRRRQQIFDADGGKCHYCATPLTLDGKWHIEHKMPKALGGGNQPSNLVASCVPCNMKKRDTTDHEFRARLAKETA